VIVVCSTSKILRNSIITKAGPQVKREYESLNSDSLQACATSSGSLPCKKILFLPWIADPSNTGALKTSLKTFVATAIGHSSAKGYKSLG
jgi:hypothetical protein